MSRVTLLIFIKYSEIKISSFHRIRGCAVTGTK